MVRCTLWGPIPIVCIDVSAHFIVVAVAAVAVHSQWEIFDERPNGSTNEKSFLFIYVFFGNFNNIFYSVDDFQF